MRPTHQDRGLCWRVLGRQSSDLGCLSASALVFASRRENFGHFVEEAVRFGLQVVISKDVDLCTVVKQAWAGLVVSFLIGDDIGDCRASSPGRRRMRSRRSTNWHELQQLRALGSRLLRVPSEGFWRLSSASVQRAIRAETSREMKLNQGLTREKGTLRRG